MPGRGAYDKLVTFQRADTTEDDYGGEETVWREIEKAWALVRFGSSQERREAAAEQSSQIATFRVLSSIALRTVTAKDRILWDGAWDIKAPGIPAGPDLEFTATRAT